NQEIMMITTEGIIIRIKVSDISLLGRNTSGVKLMNIDASSNVRVASIAKVREIEEEEDAEEESVEDGEENMQAAEVVNTTSQSEAIQSSQIDTLLERAEEDSKEEE